ncbi:iron-binding protein [Puccinia graminis f. sp. tritici]|uniref:Iron-sulfur cluster assembly protein n=1 Tax=Puccinia graminis f. sp. tritici TaxID=56615 RepID=A0A5B0MKQ0_PUCGR|nr:iron-binding protein [Puccinia graminis f. sp. tritici]
MVYQFLNRSGSLLGSLASSRQAGGRISKTMANAGPILNLQFRRSYHEKVIDHYENPRNVGSFPKTDHDVGTGLVGAPACGDVMKLQIRVDDKGIISDVKFKTFGCGSAIASSSYMTERVKGMSLQEAGAIRNTEIAKELSLPPVKLHCSMLAEDAIKAAIRDYQNKLQKAGAKQAGGFIDVSQSVSTGETIATAHPSATTK